MTRLDPRFKGNVPALVTPCDGDGNPDLPAIRRLVDHVVTNGVDAFNVLGTTGEFSLVPPRHRRPIIEAAVAAAADRVPVMVGCGRPSLAETAAEIRQAAECGAAAVLVTPSYYFPLSDSDTVRFISRLAADAPIPMLYYHYPQMTDCATSAPAILELARSGAITGIKDSSGDAAFFARLAAGAAELEDFRLFIGGSAFLLAALSLGAHGVTGALSNFAAHLDREVVEAFQAGDMTRARRAQAVIARANEVLFFRHGRNAATATKVILARLDVCGEAVFPPLTPLTEAEKQAIFDQLPSFGIFPPRRA